MNIKTKIFFIITTFFFTQFIAKATENIDDLDDLKNINLTPIQIFSTKETNLFENIPSSKTILTSTEIENKQIQNIRNLSATVPNLFVPDYGSKMSNAVYIRGVGSRSSGQTVGVYVDNVPLLDRANFNFNFFDIRQIEVLRGTQATLYGRNSMSGIINIYTLSPFEFQGTKLEIGGGNYGSRVFKASSYKLFSDKVGSSIGLFFNKTDGYFTNVFNNSKADSNFNMGGRIKFDALLSENIVSQTIFNMDATRQSAFPYGFFDEETQTQKPVNMNDASSYFQATFSISQNFDFNFKHFTVSSISSFQHLNDAMWMDQDFTSDSIFTLNQNQKRNIFSEEIIFKSKKTENNYSWNLGLFSFYDDLKPTADVLFKRNGIEKLIENNITANLPEYVQYSILDNNFLIQNIFENPTFGTAIYHQSTYNNFFIDGLNLTAGIRFDYEKTKLKYNTFSDLTQYYFVERDGIKVDDILPASIDFSGNTEKDFFQVLPKFALNFSLLPTVKFYSSASRGYKSGGFNIQMLSDLAQNDLRANMVDTLKVSIYNELTAAGMPGPVVENVILSKIPDFKRIDTAPGVIGEMLWFEPEYCWNFEIGSYLNLFNDKLNASLSLFYMDISDIQLTQFSPNGFGRMLSNAGSVTSKGFEFSLNSNLFSNFSILLNYGFADARFRNYFDTVLVFNKEQNKNDTIEINYFAKRVPYAPQHTVSVSGQYSKNISNFFVKNISLNLQYLGAGNIYWNEANNLSQDFYNVLNGKIIFDLKNFNFSNKLALELWANNITNAKYQVFYFETLGNKFFQMNKPFHFGASLKVEF